MNETSPPRFVVLLHEPGPASCRIDETHFDWMFDCGEALRTWATLPISRLDQAAELECEALCDHRRDYLDYEGPISGQRGQVKRVVTGHFVLLEATKDRFVAKLSWRDDRGQFTAAAEFYRRLPDNPLRLEDNEAWRLRFSPGR